MNSMQKAVQDFHQKFGHQWLTKPLNFSSANQQTRRQLAELLNFRMSLLQEELDELDAELFPLFDDEDGQLKPPNVVNVAAELADLIYVALGMAVCLGIDIEPVLMEIHRANMDKEPNPNGTHLKPIKPKDWTQPDIRTIIQNQQK